MAANYKSLEKNKVVKTNTIQTKKVRPIFNIESRVLSFILSKPIYES